MKMTGIPKFKINNWHWVEEEGYPEDEFDWCLLMWKTKDGSLDLFVGSYNEKEEEFYVNFGFGGAILERESVIGWVPFEECKWEI